MSQRDLQANSTVKDLIPAENTGTKFDTVGNSLTVNGSSVDLKGEGRKCLVLISVGGTSTATLEVKITSGSDDSSFGTTESETQIVTTGLTEIDFVPSNRYMRAEYTVSATGILATHTYVNFSVKAVIYNERYIPSNVT